ncbi:Mitochondrial import inner membrane translocase subunit Tim8, partial [Harpegnathos saltator]
IHAFNDICWEKCVDKPGSKLGGRTETCISNCVNRFIDVSFFVTNRFTQLLQSSV